MKPERILNVDDTDASRYVKTRILRHAGFEVIEASTGAAALDLVRSQAPDLVLLDVKLPDLNGREVCARIKADPATARTVVLQTSASHVDLRNRVDSLDAGADGYLVEPMEPEELVANVRALLRMRRAERELEEALVALKEADRRKDEFLAMLAHELRNPLAPIRNAVEILARTDDPAIVARARELIGRQASHITRLVDDLLEVSRITQGKVELRRRVVGLDAILDAAVEAIRPTIEASGLHLDVRPTPGPAWIEVDPVRISQVIGNVLHNACKFTPRGGRVAVEAQVGSRGVEIAITDTGVGIEPAQLRNIFELFTQGERSLDRAQGGLGIGLSLVKRLVEMHGGSVSAHSEGPGRGARIVLRLPPSVVRDAPDAAAAARAGTRQGALRVLVVEDNADAAEALVLLLRQLGHEVESVADGARALEAAAHFRPEVVLMDIGLPGMDGYALVREMRKRPETAAARIVAVTGYGQPADRQRSAAAGFDAHLVKPVELATLAEAMSAVAA